jgi:hypothetical protein
MRAWRRWPTSSTAAAPHWTASARTPQSGIPQLARRLFRVECARAGAIGVLRASAHRHQRLSTQDLVLLEDLARDLDQTLTVLRQARAEWCLRLGPRTELWLSRDAALRCPQAEHVCDV